jgi:CMP-N,N'-diacetyllegionaminic acid synthase
MDSKWIGRVNIHCIILARGGSKSIPQKNIMEFCGKPLLGWTIEQCIKSKSVSDIWVSSDDIAILDVAKLYGAQSIKRPTIISGDMASSESGWMHAIEYLDNMGIPLDIILAPQVTSPLRETSDVEQAINEFILNDLDSMFSASVTDDLYFWENSSQGICSVNYDYKKRKRRQDYNEQIIENGSFYLFKPEIIKNELNRLGGKIGFYVMEFWKMFEIDDFNDFRMCSALMNEFLLREK